MYNRYQGNTGKVIRVEEPRQQENSSRREMPPQSNTVPRPYPVRRSKPLFTDELTGFLKNGLGELEIEDIMLLLILYLMYRESGDSELLIIMGAMFLL